MLRQARLLGEVWQASLAYNVLDFLPRAIKVLLTHLRPYRVSSFKPSAAMNTQTDIFDWLDENSMVERNPLLHPASGLLLFVPRGFPNVSWQSLA